MVDRSFNRAILDDFGPFWASISREPDFSRPWNFQAWFLTLFSTDFEVLDEILSVVFFCEFFFFIFWHKIAYKKKVRFFFENRASLFFLVYCPLTLCQKAKKSLERLSGKSGNTRTDGHTRFLGWVLTVGENCNFTTWKSQLLV